MVPTTVTLFVVISTCPLTFDLCKHDHDVPFVQVVVKFLRKSSVLKDCWVDDEEMGRVPREIQLLARLSHPNIVQVSEYI